MHRDNGVRIGSLPWFCGAWWLGVSIILHGISWALFHLHAPHSWVWVTIDATNYSSDLPIQCAKEAGANVRE